VYVFVSVCMCVRVCVCVCVRVSARTHVDCVTGMFKLNTLSLTVVSEKVFICSCCD